MTITYWFSGKKGVMGRKPGMAKMTPNLIV